MRASALFVCVLLATSCAALPVCLVQNPGFVECTPDGDPMTFTGLDVQLLKNMFDFANFTMLPQGALDYFPPDSGYFSLVCTPQRVVQTLGILLSDNSTISQCAMGAGAITVTQERAEAGVKFGYPYVRTGLGVLVASGERTRDFNPWAFLDPFTYEVWIAMFFTVCLLPGLLFVFENLIQTGSVPINMASLDEWAHASYVMSLSVFNLDVLQVISWPCKIMLLSYCLLNLVMVATYTANLAAVLTTSVTMTGVSSISQLRGRTGVYTHGPYMERLTHYYKLTPRRMDWNGSDTFRTVAQKLRDGDMLAYIFDQALLEYYLKEENMDCSLHLISDVVAPFDYALAYHQAFPTRILQRLNIGILNMQDTNELQDLQDLYINYVTDACTQDASGSDSLAFDQVAGLWIILAGSVGLALVYSCFTVYWHHCRTPGGKPKMLRFMSCRETGSRSIVIDDDRDSSPGGERRSYLTRHSRPTSASYQARFSFPHPQDHTHTHEHAHEHTESFDKENPDGLPPPLEPPAAARTDAAGAAGEASAPGGTPAEVGQQPGSARSRVTPGGSAASRGAGSGGERPAEGTGAADAANDFASGWRDARDAADFPSFKQSLEVELLVAGGPPVAPVTIPARAPGPRAPSMESSGSSSNESAKNGQQLPQSPPKADALVHTQSMQLAAAASGGVGGGSGKAYTLTPGASGAGGPAKAAATAAAADEAGADGGEQAGSGRSRRVSLGTKLAALKAVTGKVFVTDAQAARNAAAAAAAAAADAASGVSITGGGNGGGGGGGAADSPAVIGLSGAAVQRPQLLGTGSGREAAGAKQVVSITKRPATDFNIAKAPQAPSGRPDPAAIPVLQRAHGAHGTVGSGTVQAPAAPASGSFRLASGSPGGGSSLALSHSPEMCSMSAVQLHHQLQVMIEDLVAKASLASMAASEIIARAGSGSANGTGGVPGGMPIKAPAAAPAAPAGAAMVGSPPRSVGGLAMAMNLLKGAENGAAGAKNGVSSPPPLPPLAPKPAVSPAQAGTPAAPAPAGPPAAPSFNKPPTAPAAALPVPVPAAALPTPAPAAATTIAAAAAVPLTPPPPTQPQFFAAASALVDRVSPDSISRLSTGSFTGMLLPAPPVMAPNMPRPTAAEPAAVAAAVQAPPAVAAPLVASPAAAPASLSLHREIEPVEGQGEGRRAPAAVTAIVYPDAAAAGSSPAKTPAKLQDAAAGAAAVPAAAVSPSPASPQQQQATPRKFSIRREGAGSAGAGGAGSTDSPRTAAGTPPKSAKPGAASWRI